jgi:hypothetical protein
MQNFITEYEGKQISSIIELSYIPSNEDVLEQKEPGCRWFISSTYNGSSLPSLQQYYYCDHKIPSINWELIDKQGFRIPNGEIDIEARKVLRELRQNLADNWKIAAAEIQEFHEKRIRLMEEKIQYLNSLKAEEINHLKYFLVDYAD